MPEPDSFLLRSLQVWTVGAAGGLIGAFAFRTLALRMGFTNAPNPIVRSHRTPVAYLGGCGIALGIAAVLLLDLATGAATDGRALRVCASAAVFLVLGLLDDARALSPPHKLLGQVAAALLACALGLVAPVTGQPVLDFALSAIWIVVVVNAVNFTDVCDGLVGGLAAIGLLGGALLAPGLQGLALGAGGASVGFLLLNRPPASIFLGDAGSHLLGLLLAAVGIACVQEGAGWPPFAAAVLLVGVPLFEAVFISWARVSRGLPWWRGSPDHFALRLQAHGWSRGQVDAAAWSAAAVLVVVAVALEATTGAARVGLLLAVTAAAGIVFRRLLVLAPPDTRVAEEVAETGACGLCGETALSRELDNGEARVGICRRCGSGRVLELVRAPEPDADEAYAAAYESERLESKAETCWEVFRAHAPQPVDGDTVLDVGCGGGAFLDRARGAGWQTSGIELATGSARVAREAGHRVVAGSVLDCDPDPAKGFGAVVLWDLLEHLDRPGRVLERCAGWLRPGGVLLLLTPHMGSFYDRAGVFAHSLGIARRNPLLRMCWSAAHLYRFSPAGLRDALSRAGFDEVRIEPVLLLSLQADRYAGGAVLGSWTGAGFLDRAISRAGVAVARRLGLHNKVLVVATRRGPGAAAAR